MISRCNVRGLCENDLIHVSPDGAWNDLYTPPLFDPSGDEYIMILPGKQGDKGYYKVRAITR